MSPEDPSFDPRPCSDALQVALDFRPPRGVTYTIVQDKRQDRPNRAALHSGARSVWIKFHDTEAPASVRAKLDHAAWKVFIPKPTQRPDSPRNGGSILWRRGTAGNFRKSPLLPLAMNLSLLISQVECDRERSQPGTA